jgi:hypothetical protein
MPKNLQVHQMITLSKFGTFTHTNQLYRWMLIKLKLFIFNILRMERNLLAAVMIKQLKYGVYNHIERL